MCRFCHCRLSLAALDASRNNFDSARQNLTAVLPADAKNTAAHMMRSEIDLKAGNVAAAIEHLRVVTEADDKNVLALNNLAYLLAKTDPNGAFEYAQRADELAPETAAIGDTLG